MPIERMPITHIYNKNTDQWRVIVRRNESQPPSQMPGERISRAGSLSSPNPSRGALQGHLGDALKLGASWLARTAGQIGGTALTAVIRELEQKAENTAVLRMPARLRTGDTSESGSGASSSSSMTA